jgi:hypothetical protein
MQHTNLWRAIIRNILRRTDIYSAEPCSASLRKCGDFNCKSDRKAERIGGNEMGIYFDNGSTSYPKAPGVAEAMMRMISQGAFNINRYRLSLDLIARH